MGLCVLTMDGRRSVDVLDEEGIWNTGVITDIGKDADGMVRASLANKRAWLCIGCCYYCCRLVDVCVCGADEVVLMALDQVEIKYDGWPDEYNEWIPLSAQRLAPLHMFTIVKKCWAKLTKWPWWPAFVRYVSLLLQLDSLRHHG